MIAERIPDLQLKPGARLVDFGCADAPYRAALGEGVEYVGADLPGNPDAAVMIRPDGTLEVDDGSCDAVLSTQVLEHVGDPGVYLAECFRVLRPSGRMLLSTHGFMAYHPDPVDYWRWTGAGLQRAVEDAGFTVVRFDGIMGLAASGLQLFQDGVYWRLPRFLRSALALIIQGMIRLLEFRQSDGARRLNALVFVVVAQRP